MAKYYFLLVLIMGAVLYYVYSGDPCYKNVRGDFARQFPDYEIRGSGSAEGSPQSVQCHISYLKPDDEQVYKDIWVYENQGKGWIFSRVLVAEEQLQEQFR